MIHEFYFRKKLADFLSKKESFIHISYYCICFKNTLLLLKYTIFIILSQISMAFLYNFGCYQTLPSSNLNKPWPTKVKIILTRNTCCHNVKVDVASRQRVLADDAVEWTGTLCSTLMTTGRAHGRARGPRWTNGCGGLSAAVFLEFLATFATAACDETILGIGKDRVLIVSYSQNIHIFYWRRSYKDATSRQIYGN